MRRAGYPGWRAHKALHDQMFDVVENLKADLEHGRRLDAEKLRTLLYDWLIQHILGEDKKYQPFLANPQAPTAPVWHRRGED